MVVNKTPLLLAIIPIHRRERFWRDYATKAQAIRAAQAKRDKLQRGVAEFSITLAVGRPKLYPETPVKVKGFKPVKDSQPRIMTKIIHSLNNNGYTTNLELEVLLSDISHEAIYT